MDLLKSHRRRSRVSNASYIALNVGLAVASLFSIMTTESPLIAILLVLISKWRVLAVRPRFWVANVLANIVDMIVSFSVVIMMYLAGPNVVLRVVLMIAYIVWLLVLKPQSSRRYMVMQARVAIFLGITALAQVAYGWDAVIFVAFMWLIGYSVTRHVLSTYDEEPLSNVLSFTLGLIFAELGWIGYHWLLTYDLSTFLGFQIVQLALICLVIAMMAEKAYDSYYHHGRIRRSDMLPVSVFSVSLIVILLLFFNTIGGGNAL